MKRLRPEVEICIPAQGGLAELFDGAVIATFNITYDEYDTICENASDSELRLLINVLDGNSTFKEKRDALKIRNKYVDFYKK